MHSTYAQKQKTAQKKDAPTAAAVLDSSSQSEGLQRKADITLKQTIQCYGIEPGFWQHHTLLSAYPRSGDEYLDALNVSRRRFSTDTLTDFNSVLTNQSCIELQNCNKLLPPSVDYGEVTGVECITFNRYSPFGWKSWPNVWINNENLLRHIGSNNNVTRWKRIPYQTLIHTPAQWNNAIDMSIANSVQSTQQPTFNIRAPSFRPTQQPIFNRDAPSFQPTQQPIFNRDAPSFRPTQQKAAPSTASVLDDSTQTKALQRKVDMASNAAQREEAPRPNNTGMPDNLKSGIESLSGFSMDDVRVHYNSSKPATVQALAYTQGTDIHVAPGQEKHLPHEAWHVAQQMAGRVSPTTNINGMPVNDNAELEHEADVMGEKALQRKGMECSTTLQKRNCDHIVQCMSWKEICKKFKLGRFARFKIKNLCKKNPVFAKWVDDCLNACRYVNEVDNTSGEFKSKKDADGLDKILGSPDAHYPGKEKCKFPNEMKVITILHELMHTAVRNGAYQKGVFPIDNDFFNLDDDSLISLGVKDKDSDVCDWNISATNPDEAKPQRLNLCKNILHLEECKEEDLKLKSFIDDDAFYLERRIMHIYNCPLVEYDAVLGDLVYYMMRKKMTKTNTYRYALKLLEDANERRNNPMQKAVEIMPENS